MDRETIQALRELNNGFYRAHHESFSRSRGQAWPGWERVAGHLEPGRLLDVACGNLRFERFLEERAGTGAFEFTCLDSCAELADSCGPERRGRFHRPAVSGRGPTESAPTCQFEIETHLLEKHEGCSFIECDVIDGLVEGRSLPGGFDAAVSFGFMHHVPSEGLRIELLRQLVASVRPGGVVAVSFWQFMRDARLAEKALATTQRGSAELGLALEAGDCLLGWNGVAGAYRYCHSFDDGEIDGLAQACAHKAEVADRFRADGRTGELNGYLVLRRL